MEPNDKLREYLAAALASTEKGRLEQIVAEVLRKHLADHECKQIVEAVLTPLVRKLAADVLAEPVVLESLQQRVKTELLRATGSLTIDMRPNRY
jgi:hypothetical protein